MSFLVIFLVETGEPPPYCKKSPFCMVVVLVSKSWDWVRQPPLPSLGQNPNFDRKFVSGASLGRQKTKRLFVDLPIPKSSDQKKWGATTLRRIFQELFLNQRIKKYSRGNLSH